MNRIVMARVWQWLSGRMRLKRSGSKAGALIISTALAVVLSALPGWSARTLYVAPPGAAGNIAPYTNWSNAATNIQAAINIATNGDTVVVSNGTYYLTNQVVIANFNVTVMGKTGNPADVILDGNNYAGKPVTNRCVQISGTNLFQGFTITNGCVLAKVSTFNGCGGGILMDSGSSTTRNCLITGNRALASGSASFAAGGGMFLRLGSPTVVDCTVRGNTVEGYGGGVNLYNQTVTGTLDRCTVEYNTASTNFATSTGGGVYCEKRNIVINCIVRGNTANNGGGIYSITEGGDIRNCLIRENTAYNLGGGIFQWIVNGHAVENCTIVGNTAAVNGGGLYMRDGMCRNSIIWSNTVLSGTSSNVYNYFTANATNYYCCNVPGTTSVTTNQNNSTQNPQFVNWGSGDYRLQAGSVCINSGSNRPWMDGVSDLSGHPRLDVYGGQVDRGAYEFALFLGEVSGADGGHVLYTYQAGLSEVTVCDYVLYLNAADTAGAITVSTGQVYGAGSSNLYCLTRTADTNAPVDYDALQSAGRRFAAASGRSTQPMVYVSWFGAGAYCNWQSAQDGLAAVYDPAGGWVATPANSGYRLPTEVEWRKAAAWDAATNGFYAYGTSRNTLTNTDANYLFSGDGYETNAVASTPVAAYSRSSPYGLRDASGNAWEWCQDYYYDEVYHDEDVDVRAVRGGSWGNLDSDVRVMSRGGFKPGSCLATVGFRLVTQTAQ